jgi:hypothetical protein
MQYPAGKLITPHSMESQTHKFSTILISQTQGMPENHEPSSKRAKKKKQVYSLGLGLGASEHI